jgi:hypothetical protein
LKAYLITTGSIFGLIALAHLARTITESQRLAADPWFYLEGPGLGLVAAVLSVWAWRLLWRSTRSSARRSHLFPTLPRDTNPLRGRGDQPTPFARSRELLL